MKPEAGLQDRVPLGELLCAQYHPENCTSSDLVTYSTRVPLFPNS